MIDVRMCKYADVQMMGIDRCADIILKKQGWIVPNIFVSIGY